MCDGPEQDEKGISADLRQPDLGFRVLAGYPLPQAKECSVVGRLVIYRR